MVVTKNFILAFSLLLISVFGYAQDKASDNNISTYKKRVLETIEVDILSSYYSQDGDNAAVTGGIGTEELNDFAKIAENPVNKDVLEKNNPALLTTRIGIANLLNSDKNVGFMMNNIERFRKTEINSILEIPIYRLNNSHFEKELNN